jgi:hypothetical protein
MNKTIDNWTPSKLADQQPVMGYCSRNCHQTYLYPVYEFTFTNAVGKTWRKTVLVCTCGYSYVRNEEIPHWTEVEHGPG